VRAAVLWAMALLLAGGCSLVNKPDRGKIGRDGGLPDGTVPDGGMDGGMDAGCDGPCPVPEVCNDGLDNDHNGLTDCQDYACASEEHCCVATTTASYPFAEIDRLFRVVPTEAAVRPMVMGGQIIGFGSNDNPKGIVLNRCTPMVTGVQVTAQLGVRAGGSCESALESCYAKLVLTPSSDFLEGDAFVDELAVRLDSMGRITVEQAGRVIARRESLVGLGSAVTVRMQFGPGQSQAGEPAIVGTVAIDDVTLLSRWPVQLARLLVIDSGCETNPGLFIGIEGRGNAVSVGSFGTTEQECANPSHFARPTTSVATLSRTHLGLGDWARGGLAQPALVSTTSGWDLLVDASDDARRNEELRDMGFGLGYSFTAVMAWDTSPWPSSMGQPLIGDCHASCFGSPLPGCTTSLCMPGPITSYREPSALFRAGGLLLAYVEGSVGAAQSIRTARLRRASDALPAPASTFAPSECSSVRSPSIVPAGPQITDDLWVFFTCEHDMAPSDIRVVGVSQVDLSFKSTVTTVLTATDVPEMGSLGVSSPEALVEFATLGPGTDAGMPTQATIRLWFTGQSAMGRTVGLVLASANVGADMPGAFEPYFDNPVLWADHPRLPTCAGECYLEGMSVTRVFDGSGATGRLRFLVARSVQSMSGTSYELVPVDQVWPAP